MASGAFLHQLDQELLTALQKSLGPHNLERVLRMAALTDAPVDLARLSVALEDLYGVDEGQKLMQNAGRRVLPQLWQSWRGGRLLLSLQEVLPATLALQMDLLILSEMFNRYSDQPVQLERIANGYLWRVSACIFCRGRQATRPICTGMQGLLEGLLGVAHTETFTVRERFCSAVDQPFCEFEIAPRGST